jgi:hypothetical protein
MIILAAQYDSFIESQKMNAVRATNGSPVFQGKMNELPDIYNLRINSRRRHGGASTLRADVPSAAKRLSPLRARFYARPFIAAAVVLILFQRSLQAQVVPLPAVTDAGSYPVRQVSAPDSMANVFPSPGELAAPSQISPPAKEEALSEARSGMFQKLIYDSTALPKIGGDGLGMSDLGIKMVLALPCPTPDSPLLITPGFTLHDLDGPSGAIVPSRLYDSYCQFRWLHRFSPALGVDLAITPGVQSDFEQSSSEAVRLTGHGAAAWGWSETTKIVFGVGYFNRLNVKALPIGGLIWTPDEDTNFELLFPQPRLARRIYWTGQYTKTTQDWVYLSAEFGGGTWAFARPGRQPDLIDITDYRLILGFERKRHHALSANLEVGYVFGRKVQYRDDPVQIDPSDTLMIRAGLRY